MSATLVERASSVLESLISRRNFITRSAFVGSAVAVGAGIDLALRPGTAYGAICSCGNTGCDCGSTCCAGFSEFCCSVNGGYNYCPSNTVMAGWWKADNSSYCAGPRYYMDCNAVCNCDTGCGGAWHFCEPGCDGQSCGCGSGSCDHWLTGCLQFRYGQCNQDLNCIGRIVCRVVACIPPWEIDPSCTTAVAVDEGTAEQNAPCWTSAPPVAPAGDGASRYSVLALNGRVHAYRRTTAGDLVEFINDGLNGRVWNAYDLTADAGGPGLAGEPVPLALGNTVHVYARTSNGDLVEYVSDGLNGRVWNAYDIALAALGPGIGGDPAPVAVGSTVHVYARSQYGDLVQFVGDGLNGRVWNAYDLSAVSVGPHLAGDPATVALGSVVHVYATAVNGDLVEYASDGLNGRAWNAYDLTADAAGPAIAGDPAPVVLGNTVHVYTRSRNGDLVEYVSDGLDGRVWNAYDITADAGGPGVAGDPAPLTLAPTVHVYATRTGGDLVEYVNDLRNGRVWNAYDQTVNSGGPRVAP